MIKFVAAFAILFASATLAVPMDSADGSERSLLCMDKDFCKGASERRCIDEMFQEGCPVLCGTCQEIAPIDCFDEEMCEHASKRRCIDESFVKKCPVLCGECPELDETERDLETEEDFQLEEVDERLLCEDKEFCEGASEGRCIDEMFQEGCPVLCGTCPEMAPIDCFDEEMCEHASKRRCIDESFVKKCPVLCGECPELDDTELDFDTAEECQDLTPGCAEIPLEKCEEDHMRDICPKTCGFCDSECSDQPMCEGASEERCTDEQFSKECPVLCDKCPEGEIDEPELVAGCEDLHEECWDVETYPQKCSDQFFKDNCPRSCGTC